MTSREGQHDELPFNAERRQGKYAQKPFCMAKRRSGTGRTIVPVNIRAMPGTTLKPEFESFIFASIGEDGNGTPLSVLSGLARLNIDPWLEAAELGRLPG